MKPKYQIGDEVLYVGRYKIERKTIRAVAEVVNPGTKNSEGIVYLFEYIPTDMLYRSDSIPESQVFPTKKALIASL